MPFPNTVSSFSSAAGGGESHLMDPILKSTGGSGTTTVLIPSPDEADNNNSHGGLVSGTATTTACFDEGFDGYCRFNFGGRLKDFVLQDNSLLSEHRELLHTFQKEWETVGKQNLKTISKGKRVGRNCNEQYLVRLYGLLALLTGMTLMGSMNCIFGKHMEIGVVCGTRVCIGMQLFTFTSLLTFTVGCTYYRHIGAKASVWFMFIVFLSLAAILIADDNDDIVAETVFLVLFCFLTAKFFRSVAPLYLKYKSAQAEKFQEFVQMQDRAFGNDRSNICGHYRLVISQKPPSEQSVFSDDYVFFVRKRKVDDLANQEEDNVQPTSSVMGQVLLDSELLSTLQRIPMDQKPWLEFYDELEDVVGLIRKRNQIFGFMLGLYSVALVLCVAYLPWSFWAFNLILFLFYMMLLLCGLFICMAEIGHFIIVDRLVFLMQQHWNDPSHAMGIFNFRVLFETTKTKMISIERRMTPRTESEVHNSIEPVFPSATVYSLSENSSDDIERGRSCKKVRLTWTLHDFFFRWHELNQQIKDFIRRQLAHTPSSSLPLQVTFGDAYLRAWRLSSRREDAVDEGKDDNDQEDGDNGKPTVKDAINEGKDDNDEEDDDNNGKPTGQNAIDEGNKGNNEEDGNNNCTSTGQQDAIDEGNDDNNEEDGNNNRKSTGTQ